MENLEFPHLMLLIQANSKSDVRDICRIAFDYQSHRKYSKHDISTVASKLWSKFQPTSQMMLALSSLIHNAVFQSSTELVDIAHLFPDDFHKSLKELLCKIIKDLLPEWKEKSARNITSLPHLVDFDWSVNVHTSANDQSQASAVPTCRLHLQIEDKSSTVEMKKTHVEIDFTKDNIDEFLRRFSKIQNQLTSIANT